MVSLLVTYAIWMTVEEVALWCAARAQELLALWSGVDPYVLFVVSCDTNKFWQSPLKYLIINAHMIR